MERFFVRAGSVNQVRRALDRAPGGAEVVGRFDRERIECRHTMSAQSFARHWPVLLSRFEKAGIELASDPYPSGESHEDEGESLADDRLRSTRPGGWPG